MSDFSIRSDSVNVEEIMGQIRARIRDKRGVDYTEQEIRELADAKLEKFLDPTKVRSDLLDEYRQLQRQQMSSNIELDEETLFGSPRPFVRRIRRWLRPVLKLFLNPLPLMRVSRVNDTMVRHGELFYELVHNLVIETTRLGIEVKTLKMRVESLSSRLDFDERRGRALEGVVQYRPPAPVQEAAPAADEESETESSAARSRRRRRRRGRRGGGPHGGAEGGPGTGDPGQAAGEDQSERLPAPEGQPRDRSDEQRSPVGHAPDVTTAGTPALAEPRPGDAGRAPEAPQRDGDSGDPKPGSSS
jgi:hypothetical protein